MPYRQFARPNVPIRYDEEWLTWLGNERVLHSPAPSAPGTCRLCFGPVGTTHNGEPFVFCVHCWQYRGVLDALVPITYSLDSGLESILHDFKDGTGYEWFSWPLGSMISTFLRTHKCCIERRIGGNIEIAIPVPSNDTDRTFDHIFAIVNGVEGGGQILPWRWDLLSRNRSVDRPTRGTIVSQAYDLVPGSVRQRRVLLFDDTWTSGASLVSCAQKLKEGGAMSVCALTLGRQLNTSSDYGNNQKIVAEAILRDKGKFCVLCSP